MTGTIYCHREHQEPQVWQDVPAFQVPPAKMVLVEPLVNAELLEPKWVFKENTMTHKQEEKYYFFVFFELNLALSLNSLILRNICKI